MARKLRRRNAKRAKVRVAVEHVFAVQKTRLKLVVRSVGQTRAAAKLGLANLVTNLLRLVWLETRVVSACLTPASQRGRQTCPTAESTVDRQSTPSPITAPQASLAALTARSAHQEP